MARILVIEDDEDILDILRYVLIEDGHEVIASPKTLLIAEAENLKPDIILLDEWLMGDEKGSTWCRKLKVDSQIAHIPVLMLSAFTPIEHVVAEAGADGYIKKPFDIDGLCQQVNGALNAR